MQPGGKYRFSIPVEDFKEAMRSQAAMPLAGPEVIWDMELLEVLPPKPDGARLVAQAIRQDGPDEAYKLYQALARKNAAYFGEWEVNQVGYLFLQQGKTEESIRILLENVHNFPNSANAHDSLAEAYLKAGDTAQAIEHYNRSLSLNPGNENARSMLAKLRE
ncbi:MAG: tetratricopeptide repeat protein [Phaeodactylibacter sp.]|nr:tetratricopeptide repeat protein [Phaeodactylibacter sp.]